MNKAFTANINDQVTARGYLDENDQLIMLEPEGSGGGGAYITVYENATASFTWSAEDEQATLNTEVEITANKIYKITIDEDVFYNATYAVNDHGDVSVRDVPADSDALGGNYLALNDDGSLSVYGDTAETWAGTTHTVKIEEMAY